MTTNTTTLRRNKFRAAGRTNRKVGSRFARLGVQCLESREVPATFTVTNVSDGTVANPGDLPGSLRQAIFDANVASSADSIVFDSFFSTPQTITLSKGELLITDGVTITGPGSTLLTVSPNYSSRAFHIVLAHAADPVTFFGLTIYQGRVLANSAVGLGGGAIYDENATLTVDSCVVSTCNAVSGPGGGIRIDGQQALIVDSKFISNKCALSGGNGGAIASIMGDLTIQYCEFDGNDIDGAKSPFPMGGAIYASGTLTVENSSIHDGTAFTGSGAGIAFELGTALISGSTITLNQTLQFPSPYPYDAQFSGAGIFGRSGDITISSCEITDNDSSARGGGIFGYAKFEVDSCVISGNTARRGGGIDIETEYASYAGSLELTNSTISGNEAVLEGGGIRLKYLSASYSTSIGDCTISNNQVSGTDGVGAGIWLSSPTASTFSNLWISKNTATLSGGGVFVVGGAYYAKPSFDACTFSSNKIIVHAKSPAPSIAGAGVGVEDFLGEINFSDVTITTNSAVNSKDAEAAGGGVALGVLSGNAGTVNFSGSCEITKNSASVASGGTGVSRGAGIAIGGHGTIQITNALVTSNTLAQLGGGIYITSTPTVTLNGCAIGGNNANTGAGIFADLASLTLDVIGGMIMGNTINASTGGHGGGVYSQATVTNITGAEINLNSADGDGGGVYFDSAFGTLTLTGGIIGHNTAANSGGGVFIKSGDATITRTRIGKAGMVMAGNSAAGGSGGGLQIETSGAVILDQVTVSDNTAMEYGGGLSLDNPSGLEIRDSTINANSTNSTGGFDGGGIWVDGGTMTVIQCTISGNSAPSTGSYGGGMAIDGYADVTIYNSTIASNSATGKGGGIALLTGSLDLYSTIVGDNSAGTGPHIFGGTVNADFCIIETKTGISTLTGTGTLHVDPGLDVLGFYGGPTKTHRLQTASPALDVGNNSALSLTYDQRGLGFVREEPSGLPDIGAFEDQATQMVAKVQCFYVDGSTPYYQNSRVNRIEIAFSQPVTFLNPSQPEDAFELTYDSGPGSAGTVTLDPTGFSYPNSSTVVIAFATGTYFDSGFDVDSLIDGLYQLKVIAGEIVGLPTDYLTPAASTGTDNEVWRLFGDAAMMSDRTVAANDFIAFRVTFGGTGAGSPNVVFDIDNDGAIAANDFIAFRLRFGGSI